MMSRTNNSAQNDVYPKYQNNFLIIQDVITKTYQEIKNSIQFSNFEKKLGIFSKLKLKSLTWHKNKALKYAHCHGYYQPKGSLKKFMIL